MSESGVATTNLPLVDALDEVIGNVVIGMVKKTARITTSALAIQIGGGGGGGGSFAAVPTIADLLLLSGAASNNDTVIVLGRNSVGDGGGGTFRWNAASTAISDNGTIFGTGTGRWYRLIDGDWSTAWFGIPADGETDVTAELNAAMAVLSARGGGTLNLIDPTTLAPFYINSTWRGASNVRMRGGCNEFLLGENARGFAQGEIVTEGSGHIGATINATDTVIQLASGASNDYLNYTDGDYLIIRGQNDKTGEAIKIHNCRVTNVDSVNNRITVTPAVPSQFLISWPGSDWGGEGGTDYTLIVRVVKTDLTADGVIGEYTLNVDNGGLFEVNEVVCKEDAILGSDISGTSNNQFRMQTNKIIAIDGNDLTFQQPIAHAFETAYGACVQKMTPIVNFIAEGIIVRFDEESADNNKYTFATKYAIRCGFVSCEVLGVLGGLGPRSHCFRLGEGSWDCYTDLCKAIRPMRYGSGQGYGFTVYAGASNCRHMRWYAEGCRHSTLAFSGACYNRFENGTSVDCRGTDLDVHGAEESFNVWLNNTIIPGPSTTEEGPGGFDVKAAIKHGNPTHRRGGRGNVFKGTVILGQYIGFIVHIHPGSDAVVEGTIANEGATLGFCNLQCEDEDTSLKILNTTLRNNIFKHGDVFLKTDGGDANRCIDGLTIDDNTATELGGSEAPIDLKWCNKVRGRNNRIQSAAVGTIKMLRITDSLDVVLRDFELEGGDTGVYMSNSPSAILSGFDFRAINSRRIFDIAGTGNSGTVIDDYEAYGFDPDFGNGATSGVIFRPRRKQTANAVSAASRPTTVAGSSHAISMATYASTAPASTIGVEILAVAIKAMIPRGRMRVEATIPMLNVTGADTTAVMTLWRDQGSTKTLIGGGAVRLHDGATFGAPLPVECVFAHTATDLGTAFNVTARLMLTDAGATLSFNDRFNAAMNTPSIFVEELAA